jgi:benzoate membrane transport protein
MNRILSDWSLSAFVAGLVALVATFSGPVLIVVEAGRAGHLDPILISTWIWALSFGAGILSLWCSLRYRVPVIGAWSTPSVVLLMNALSQHEFSDVIGCYLLVAILVTYLGYSKIFSKLLSYLPTHLLTAMISGVLFQFCIKIFQSLEQVPTIVLPILASYLIARRLIPRYSVAIGLLVGLAPALINQYGSSGSMNLMIAHPVITLPTFRFDTLISLGLPLLLLALTQYATGITVLKNAGYKITDRSLVTVSGLISIPFSLFGSSGINPAAIVGAICASPECHQDPKRRYISGLVCGFFYLVLGAFGASIVGLFSLLPSHLITVLAGLALLSTLISSLATSFATESTRDSATITFAVTVSGMSFFGLGSALWGLIAGMIFTTLTTRSIFSQIISQSEK